MNIQPQKIQIGEIGIDVNKYTDTRYIGSLMK